MTTTHILARDVARSLNDRTSAPRRSTSPEVSDHTLVGGLGLGVAAAAAMVTPFGQAQAADATNNYSLYLFSGAYTNEDTLTNNGWIGVGYEAKYSTSAWSPSSISPALGTHNSGGGYLYNGGGYVTQYMKPDGHGGYVYGPNTSGEGAIPTGGNTTYGPASLTNESTIQNKSTLAVSQYGTLTIGNAGLLTNSGTANNLGSLDIDGGTLNNVATGTLNNLSGGTLTNGGTTNNSGAFNNQAGATLNNNDTLNNLSGGTLSNSGTTNNADTFNNQAGATLNNQSSGTLTNADGATVTNGGTVNNAGTLTNQSGGGNGLYNQNGGVLNNLAGGVLDNQAGANLTNEGSGTLDNAGTLTNQASATLTNQTGGTLTNRAGGSLTNNGILDNGGTLDNQSGANLTNASGATLTNQPTGTVNNAGILDNAGTIDNDGGIFNNSAGAQVNNTGDLKINGGTLNNAGTITNDGWFESVNAGTLINNQAGGVIDNKAGRRLQNGAGTVNNDGTIDNAGEVWNYGTFNISSTGKVQGTGNFIQKDVTGAHTLVDGLLHANLIDIQGGTLTGTGTLEGTVQIGADATLNAGHSPGTIHVNGDLNVSGTLMVELTGTSPATLTGIDFYDVTGTASFLSGSQIVFDDLSWLTTPGTYDFNFLSAASIVGLNNASFTFNGLGAWANGNVSLAGTTLKLDITEKSPSGGGSIPEPAPWTLLLFGLGAFGASRRYLWPT